MNNMNNIKEIASRLLNDMDTIFFKNNTLTTATVFVLIVRGMETVEKYNNLCGIEKKAVVLEMIKLSINKYIPDANEALVINTFVDTMGSYMIDEFVDIGKNGIDINKRCSIFKKLCCVPTSNNQ